MSFKDSEILHDTLFCGHIPDNIYKWLDLPTESYFLDLFFNKNRLPFINSPEFQRMRDIRQLGPSSSYVFPGATHTRFEHCLGTGHLANKMITNLHAKQKGLEISNNDIIDVTLAGLLHDLGHAASSHQFEKEVIRVLEYFCKIDIKKALLLHGLMSNNLAFLLIIWLIQIILILKNQELSQ